MPTISINQSVNIQLTKKSIEWLVNHTHVAVFDPISFDGYQRQIDKSHCQKIVDYLKNDFLLPSAIICACETYSEDSDLRIVDGQHRVTAFKMLKEQDEVRFSQIKELEIAIIVLVGVQKEVEIDTFIRINKTSKKVDTSLAYVLKNKISNAVADDLAMSKAEFLSVEAAQLLNSESCYDLWYNKILFEGNVKKSDAFISLNSFVKTTRILVNLLKQKGFINFNWISHEEVKEAVTTLTKLIDYIWQMVYQKWSFMYSASLEDRQILQGSIGYSAITRAIIIVLRSRDISNIKEAYNIIRTTIQSFSIDGENWKKGGVYSRYSSESGIKIVSDELLKDIMH